MGFSKVKDEEGIYFCDNMSFDGTQRDGKLTSDGEVWIGSAVAPHVRSGTITSSDGSINVVKGNGTINLLVTSTINNSIVYTSVVFAQTPYTVGAIDQFLGVNVTGGAITIKLPDSPVTGRVYSVKDTVGNSSVSNITVTTTGGAVTIDGSATFVMNTNYSSINLVFSGTSYEVF